MEMQDVLELLRKKDIDLEELETSEEYTWLNWNSITGNIYKDLRGATVTIDGDVERILLYGRNEMKLYVVYSLRSSVIDDNRIAIINVMDDKLKDRIKKNVLPNTRIKVTARFNGEVDEYDLIDVLDTDVKMKFGHYICSDFSCQHDYGRKVDSDYCCFCEGSPLEYVDCFYKVGSNATDSD